MAFPNQVLHGWMHGKVFVLSEDVDGEIYTGRWEGNRPVMTPHPLKAGTKVKVVMVSRFYDAGITDDLSAENGYVARVNPALLILHGKAETKDQALLKHQAHQLWAAQQESFSKGNASDSTSGP